MSWTLPNHARGRRAGRLMGRGLIATQYASGTA